MPVSVSPHSTLADALSCPLLQEVLNGSLQRPSRMPQFQNMCIRDSILDCRMLRDPLNCEIGPLGQRIAMCVSASFSFRSGTFMMSDIFLLPFSILLPWHA